MISDFRCTFDNVIGISPEITKDLKLSSGCLYACGYYLRKSNML